MDFSANRILTKPNVKLPLMFLLLPPMSWHLLGNSTITFQVIHKSECEGFGTDPRGRRVAGSPLGSFILG